LRASGWSDTEVRDYKRGYESAGDRARAPLPPPAAPAPEVRQWGAPVPVHATGARAIWLRDTWGGRISRLFPPPDEAAELAAAKAEADRHEFTYGSRPDLAQFLHKVRGSGSGTGTVLTGETADLLGAIRLANPDQPIQMVVGPDPASAQIGGVVTSPGGGPEPHGDPGLAAGMLQQLARRQ
jgi:hypothetical protein